MLGKLAGAGSSCVIAALAFIPGTALAADATIERAAAAMGAGALKSLRYTADGTGYTFGQAYKPGMPWPRIKVHSLVRTINYETGAMRDEIVLSRAEALGGGGYPHVAQQRNDQYVSGGFAWNQAGAAPAPGPRFVADRVHQLWITPQGVLKAAMKNNATVSSRNRNGQAFTAVTFTEPTRFVATAYITITKLLADELGSRFGSRAGVFVAPDGAPPLDAAMSAAVSPVNTVFTAAYAGHLYPW